MVELYADASKLLEQMVTLDTHLEAFITATVSDTEPNIDSAKQAEAHADQLKQHLQEFKKSLATMTGLASKVS